MTTLRSLNGNLRNEITSLRTEILRQTPGVVTILEAQNRAVATLRSEGTFVPRLEGEPKE